MTRMNPDIILDFSTDLSVFYSIEIGFFAFKIDMSTCRSVQAVPYESTGRSIHASGMLNYFFVRLFRFSDTPHDLLFNHVYDV